MKCKKNWTEQLDEECWSDADYGQFVYFEEGTTISPDIYGKNLESPEKIICDFPVTLKSSLLLHVKQAFNLNSSCDYRFLYGFLNLGSLVIAKIPSFQEKDNSVMLGVNLFETNWTDNMSFEKLMVSIRKTTFLRKDTTVGVASVCLKDCFGCSENCAGTNIVLEVQKEEKISQKVMNKLSCSRMKPRLLCTGALHIEASLFHFTHILCSQICFVKGFSCEFTSSDSHTYKALFSPTAASVTKECCIVRDQNKIGRATLLKRYSLDPQLGTDNCSEIDVLIFNSIGQHVATLSQVVDFERNVNRRHYLLLDSTSNYFDINGKGEIIETQDELFHYIHFYSISHGYLSSKTHAAGQVTIKLKVGDEGRKDASELAAVEVKTTRHCSEQIGMLIGAGMMLLAQNIKLNPLL